MTDSGSGAGNIQGEPKTRLPYHVPRKLSDLTRVMSKQIRNQAGETPSGQK